MCNGLSMINNGMVVYSPDSTAPYDYGTTATYSCNEGFFLQGSSVRTCGEGLGTSGLFDGVPPVCTGI